MGDTAGKTVAQWTMGDYDANASNSEDELAIISDSIPYISDDNGDDINTATTLVTTRTKLAQKSVVPTYVYTSSISVLLIIAMT
jgi:hypothetical protein